MIELILTALLNIGDGIFFNRQILTSIIIDRVENFELIYSYDDKKVILGTPFKIVILNFSMEAAGGT